MRTRMGTWQLLTRALCVIALVAVGFAHRAPTAAASKLSSAEVAALTLPDGSLPELCLPGQDDDGAQKDHLGSGTCEACLISASVLLPSPTDLTGARIVVVAETLLPPRFEAFHRLIFPPNAAPRAPPHPALV
ncbi:hypothetical protein HHL25_15685 [Rhizobium sp. S-51]|uniref:DUF2946 domain-containing protein n=1 Tax=Rhizobium terricola TaxID=2728849 RepID=A0A7Y0AXZ3_9HYPH|nr:DUF2946 family protein [Rhizobium terricola]NML75574.1 hypothetical protein [Rhizobium terricola]